MEIFNESIVSQGTEFENEYNLGFMKFIESLEEKGAQTWDVSLNTNEDKLKAKKDNEVDLFSVS